LKALNKYLYKGGISPNTIGLSYPQAREELLAFRGWLLKGKGEFLEDRLLEMLIVKAGVVKMEKTLKAFTPAINTLLFKRASIPKALERQRRKLIRTIPIVTVVLLYGFLKASGRLVNNDTPSTRTAKSSLYVYKLCKQMEDDFEEIIGLFQGFVVADLPKLMFISVNTSPEKHEKRLAKRGFPPAVLWLLKKYRRIIEYEREYCQ